MKQFWRRHAALLLFMLLLFMLTWRVATPSALARDPAGEPRWSLLEESVSEKP